MKLSPLWWRTQAASAMPQGRGQCSSLYLLICWISRFLGVNSKDGNVLCIYRVQLRNCDLPQLEFAIRCAALLDLDWSDIVVVGLLTSSRSVSVDSWDKMVLINLFYLTFSFFGSNFVCTVTSFNQLHKLSKNKIECRRKQQIWIFVLSEIYGSDFKFSNLNRPEFTHNP